MTSVGISSRDKSRVRSACAVVASVSRRATRHRRHLLTSRTNDLSVERVNRRINTATIARCAVDVKGDPHDRARSVLSGPARLVAACRTAMGEIAGNSLSIAEVFRKLHIHCV